MQFISLIKNPVLLLEWFITEAQTLIEISFMYKLNAVKIEIFLFHKYILKLVLISFTLKHSKSIVINKMFHIYFSLMTNRHSMNCLKYAFVLNKYHQTL